MTNLTYSLEIAEAMSDNETAIEKSISFLCSDVKTSAAYFDTVDMIRKTDRLLLKLTETGGITLSDHNSKINFYNLCDALQSGEIHTAYRSCKVIRAEMLIETTPEKLEEFKRLTEFWEMLELNFGMMLK